MPRPSPTLECIKWVVSFIAKVTCMALEKKPKTKESLHLPKTDEFSEKFKTRGGGEGGHFWSKKLYSEISFIFRKYLTRKVNVSQQICNIIRKWGGWSKAVWNFSKNSSVLIGGDFPKGSYRDLAAEMQTLFRKVGYKGTVEFWGEWQLRGQELKYEITGLVI